MKQVWVQIDTARTNDGIVYGLSFPDFPGVVTCGDSLNDVLRRGREVYAFHSACTAADNAPMPLVRTHRAVTQDTDVREALAKGGAKLLCLGVKAAGSHTLA